MEMDVRTGDFRVVRIAVRRPIEIDTHQYHRYAAPVLQSRFGQPDTRSCHIEQKFFMPIVGMELERQFSTSAIGEDMQLLPRMFGHRKQAVRFMLGEIVAHGGKNRTKGLLMDLPYLTLNSPLSSRGSSVSRKAARVRDWSMFLLIWSNIGLALALKDSTSFDVGIIVFISSTLSGRMR